MVAGLQYGLADMTTDDLWDGNTTQDDGYQDISHFMPNGQNSGILQNFWAHAIRASHPATSDWKKIPTANMNETLRNQRTAEEVRFLRAFASSISTSSATSAGCSLGAPVCTVG